MRGPWKCGLRGGGQRDLAVVPGSAPHPSAHVDSGYPACHIGNMWEGTYDSDLGSTLSSS